MKTCTLLLAAGLAVGLPFSAFAKIERVVEKTFTVQPGGIVKAETQGGDIRVQPGAADAVTVVAKQRIRADSEAEADELLKDLTLTIEQQGNDVAVVAKYAKKPFSFHFGSWPPVQVDVVVTVPGSFDAALKTSGGDIVVGNLTGAMHARTSGGDINFGEIDGTIDAGTSGGDVVVGACSGAAALHTSGGDITVHRVASTLKAHTSGGDVQAAIVGALQGDCSLSTSGGDIKVTVDKTASFQLDATTSGGRVHGAGLTIALEKGGLGKSRLMGKVNAGGPPVKLRTSGGDIDVTTR